MSCLITIAYAMVMMMIEITIAKIIYCPPWNCGTSWKLGAAKIQEVSIVVKYQLDQPDNAK